MNTDALFPKYRVACYHVDPFKIAAGVGTVLMMMGKLPLNKRTVGVLLLLTQTEFKITWEA